MNRTRISRVIGVAIILSCAVVGSVALASAEIAQPGEPCDGLHATAFDPRGRMLTCNPTMTGTHSLVWQYGGPR